MKVGDWFQYDGKVYVVTEIKNGEIYFREVREDER